MKNAERTIYVYDIKVDKRAVHALPPALVEMANVWQAAFTAGTAIHKREKGSVVYRIGGMVVDDTAGTMSLLIRRADIAAPDAAYSNMDNGDLRIAKKTPVEGGDTAAHLTVSLRPERRDAHSYLAFLEGVPRIGHHYVQALLNGIIRASCSDDRQTFHYPHPSGAKHRDGSAQLKPFVPTIELRAHLADDFISDLENGTVSNIELIKQEGRTALGGNSYLEESSSILKIDVDKNLPRSGRLDSLIQAMSSKKKDFQVGRIRFQDTHKNSHTVEVDLDSGAIEQGKFIKNFTIAPIDPPLAQSTDVILARLIDPMIAKLLADRHI
jgi:hypothetical protein